MGAHLTEDRKTLIERYMAGEAEAQDRARRAAEEQARRAAAAEEAGRAAADAARRAREEARRVAAEAARSAGEARARAAHAAATDRDDYYEILGVSRDADTAELKRAFRQRAREFHPDVTAAADGEDRFREITAIYDVLSDPKARASYDQDGPRRFRAAAAHPPAPPLDLELDWYEAKRGVSKLLSYEEPVACATCAGRGVAGGGSHATCAHCRGEGVIKKAAHGGGQTRLIQFEHCAACDGRGHYLADLCTTCAGTGSRTVVRTARVRVPADVHAGDLLEFDELPRRFRIRIFEPPSFDSKLVLVIAAVGLACALAVLFVLVR